MLKPSDGVRKRVPDMTDPTGGGKPVGSDLHAIAWGEANAAWLYCGVALVGGVFGRFLDGTADGLGVTAGAGDGVAGCGGQGGGSGDQNEDLAHGVYPSLGAPERGA